MPEATNKKSNAGNSEELCDEQLEDASGGVVESIGVKYTMFSPDGKPVRSDSKSEDINTGPVESLKK